MKIIRIAVSSVVAAAIAETSFNNLATVAASATVSASDCSESCSVLPCTRPVTLFRHAAM